ncbi:hypothetical protein [Fuscibacter oryzae]|uniref:Uncharacterized protein n=1 Tax=Fuscibacter oryzae TaxID=2803939 RepID=A0A8J7MPQ8_9RHOB|nr:hypothetical protein [Fuscibacter oryzae]MBL4927247.1 hypothetical protein [Fuscibacter oryzae]
MDHHDHHEAVEGPWAGGWLVALVAGLFAALLARAIGATGMSAAMAVGTVTFLVFAALLGNGGVELTLDDSHGDDHGHGHH